MNASNTTNTDNNNNQPKFKKGDIVSKSSLLKSSVVMLWRIDEVRKIDNSYIYGISSYKENDTRMSWTDEKELVLASLVNDAPEQQPDHKLQDRNRDGNELRAVLSSMLNSDRTDAGIFTGIDRLARKVDDANGKLGRLRHDLSWSLGCDNDDKSIFAKIDYVKNLAYNPARYRAGTEVQFNPALLTNKEAPIQTTITKVVEAVPQSDGSYLYHLEYKPDGENRMMVKEANIRPVVYADLTIVEVDLSSLAAHV